MKFKEENLPALKEEYPHLKKSQYDERLFKQFKKLQKKKEEEKS
jgi:hypothetical protein